MSGLTTKRALVILTIVVLILIVLIILTFCRCRQNRKSLRQSRGPTIEILDRQPRRNEKTDQRIPRVIMQTNQNKDVPVRMHQAMETICKQNPEYAYVYFDDERARAFLLEEYGDRYLKAYDDLIPGAYKADYFRYAYLCKRGGVYLDTGMVCIKPLREVIRPNDQFISPEDDGCGGIYNAFICSVPDHPIIKKCLDICLHNIESRYMGPDTLHITGPDMMAACFTAVVGKEVNPNLDYGNGIRLIYHRSAKSKRTEKFTNCGSVFNEGDVILHTKYIGYSEDMAWYHINEHYSILWKQGRVYKGR